MGYYMCKTEPAFISINCSDVDICLYSLVVLVDGWFCCEA